MTVLIARSLQLALIVGCALAQRVKQMRRLRPSLTNNDIVVKPKAGTSNELQDDDADYSECLCNLSSCRASKHSYLHLPRLDLVKYGILKKDSRSVLDPDDKNAMLDIFIHNFIQKLDRMVHIIDNKKITEKFEEISNEYYSRLADDTVRSSDGFDMGDATLHLMKVANLVLDTADIREMKKLGVLKKTLERQIQKQREELAMGGKGPSYLSESEMDEMAQQESPDVLEPNPLFADSNLEGFYPNYFAADEAYYSDIPQYRTGRKGFKRLELPPSDTRRIAPMASRHDDADVNDD
jgi:hypothetical protein